MSYLVIALIQNFLLRKLYFIHFLKLYFFQVKSIIIQILAL